jgi:hypothetical protein
MTTLWKPTLCVVWRKPHAAGGKYYSKHRVAAPLSTPLLVVAWTQEWPLILCLRCLPQLQAVFTRSLFFTSQPIHPYFMLCRVWILVPKIKERTIITWTHWSNGNALDFAAGRHLVQILAWTPASMTEVFVSSFYPTKCKDIAPVRPQPHLSKHFSIHHSSFILPSDTTLSNINKKNKIFSTESTVT